MKRNASAATLLCLLFCFHLRAWAQTPLPTPQKVILDTDIGDDIDDAYALGLVLSSPELKLLGVTTALGDTALRARLARRILCETGEQAIPVIAGISTKAASRFSQASWASRFPPAAEQNMDVVAWMAKTIRQNPGQITLIAIAPMSNVGALIERDPEAFHLLKRVVLMGGSIDRGYDDLGYAPNQGPSAEYNIRTDVQASQKLFTSGVPIYMAPLDSTQLKLDEVMRPILFRRSTPLTDSLTVLTDEWSAATHNMTPTLFDVMAVGLAIDPQLCPTQPMHIRVDDHGFTRVESGAPNAFVCLHSDSDRFFQFLLPRLMNQRLGEDSGSAGCSTQEPK
ncbi:MAG: nucleoside hydrolase [Acidobacteriaceae bacterium]